MKMVISGKVGVESVDCFYVGNLWIGICQGQPDVLSISVRTDLCGGEVQKTSS